MASNTVPAAAGQVGYDQTMHGARAKIMVVDGGDIAKTLGIFNSVQYGASVSTQPIFVLGAFEPQQIVYVAQEQVTLRCSGFRVVDHGAFASVSFPTLNDLLNYKDLTIQIVDRLTGKVIMRIEDVKPTSYGSTLSARNLGDITVEFVGRVLRDESSELGTTADATAPTSFPGT